MKLVVNEIIKISESRPISSLKGSISKDSVDELNEECELLDLNEFEE